MEQERLARRPSGGAWEGFRLAQGEGRHLLESWPCGEIDEIEVGWVFWSIVLIIMIISYVYIVIHTAITVLSFVWRLVWRSLDSGSGIFASTWVILRLRNFGFGLVSLGRCWGLFFFFPVSGASASLPGSTREPLAPNGSILRRASLRRPPSPLRPPCGATWAVLCSSTR